LKLLMSAPGNRFTRTAASTLAAAVLLSSSGAAAPVSFRNDVMAVLSKAGCNSGPCHGNQNGKASFKLSLRGEDPELDLKALTRDMFARRVNPNDPDQSLMLLKATAQLAHEGGLRLRQDSGEYALIRDWIVSGATDDPDDAPKLERIEVMPTEKILGEPVKTIALRAKATFSDGTQRDVTRLAVYEPANSFVKVAPDGVVEREALAKQPCWFAISDSNGLFALRSSRRPRLRLEQTAPEQLHRRAGICQTAHAADEPVRVVHGHRILATRLSRFARYPAHGGGGARLRHGKRSPEKDEAHRSAAGPAGVRRFLGAQVVGHSAQRRKGPRPKGHSGVSRLDPPEPRGEQTDGPVRARDRFPPAAARIRIRRPAFIAPIAMPPTRSEAVAQLSWARAPAMRQVPTITYDRWTQADYYDWADVFARVNTGAVRTIAA
jgi:hypothetical protein